MKELKRIFFFIKKSEGTLLVWKKVVESRSTPYPLNLSTGVTVYVIIIITIFFISMLQPTGWINNNAKFV